MKRVLHSYFIISEECFLEQLSIIQNILGLYHVTARKDNDLESTGGSLESQQKYYGCDISDRPDVARGQPKISITQMGDLDSL